MILLAAAAFLVSPALAENGGKPERPIHEAFAKNEAKVVVPPGVSETPVHWEFKNHWDFPLVIEAFEQACGCLSGKIDEASAVPVPPGGTGRIQALFAPGSYRGVVRKSLHVRFAGHKGAVELVAEARIPSTVELSSQELSWTRGGMDGARIVDVTAGTDTAFRILGLSGVTPAHFTIDMDTVTEGRHYRLSIKPAAGVADGAKTLLIRTDSRDPRDQVKAVFLRMKPAETTDRGADPNGMAQTAR